MSLQARYEAWVVQMATSFIREAQAMRDRALKLPVGYALTTDERPLLRDERGHVLAVVEAWRPDAN